MTRLFQTNLTQGASTIDLSDENIRIVRDVLRCKPGDEIEMVDGSGLILSARLLELTKKKGSCEILKATQGHRHVPEVTLFQGTPKGEKSSWIVQKAVEWGVRRLVFLETEHSVVKGSHGQLDRWTRVAHEALRQSGNPFLPEICGPLLLSEATEKYKSEVSVLFDENQKGKKLRDQLDVKTLSHSKSVCVAVGPEGGWSTIERALFQKTGFISAGLGPYILRTETAGVSAIAFIHALIG